MPIRPSTPYLIIGMTPLIISILLHLLHLLIKITSHHI